MWFFYGGFAVGACAVWAVYHFGVIPKWRADYDCLLGQFHGLKARAQRLGL